jgi:polyhydroxyalkanoate synthesis regulator phasin
MKPLNKATPTLTGEAARRFLKEVEETNKKAESFKRDHPEEYKRRIKSMEENLNAILSKAKL